MSCFRCTCLTLLLSATTALAQPPANLVLAIGGEPETGFDPLLGWGNYGNPLFQSTLLRRDAGLETQGDLATRWQLSPDRKSWMITIRDDIRFADGTPLTAKDVAFTFNRAKTSAGPVDLTVMIEAVALDNHTLRIDLEKPWITFSEAFYTLGIVPEASYGPGYGRQPVGSGPFRLVSWSEGEQLIVAPNEYYHGTPSPFAQLTFLFTGEDAGLAAARAGMAHLVAVSGQSADAVPAGFHALPVQTVDNRGISLPFPAPHEVDGNRFGNAVTADPAIREALNLGLDRNILVDVALNGHGTPAFGPADGLPWAGIRDRVDFDLSGAQAILEQAGWLPGRDGIRARNGIRASFPINYPGADPTRQALAEATAELLRPLGIEAVPVGGSWNSIGRVMHAEPVVFGFGSHSPYQIYSLFAEDLAGVEYMNPTHYRNPRVEALLEQAQAAESLEASFPLWSQAADHYGLQGDNAWLWLVNLDHVYFVNDCLDLGPTQIEPHGHGWPITSGIANWRWVCD